MKHTEKCHKALFINSCCDLSPHAAVCPFSATPSFTPCFLVQLQTSLPWYNVTESSCNIYVWVLGLWVRICTMEGRNGYWVSLDRVIDSCVLPRGCWELNPGAASVLNHWAHLLVHIHFWSIFLPPNNGKVCSFGKPLCFLVSSAVILESSSLPTWTCASAF